MPADVQATVLSETDTFQLMFFSKVTFTDVLMKLVHLFLNQQAQTKMQFSWLDYFLTTQWKKIQESLKGIAEFRMLGRKARNRKEVC